MPAHNADAEESHRGLSIASFAIWPQLHPRAFISRSTDLLYVPFGRPLLLYQAGVQGMATLGMDVGGILLTCPIHLYLLSLPLARRAASQFARGATYWLSCFGQKMCIIVLRDLFWNTFRMRHIPLVTFQDSVAYSNNNYYNITSIAHPRGPELRSATKQNH